MHFERQGQYGFDSLVKSVRVLRSRENVGRQFIQKFANLQESYQHRLHGARHRLESIEIQEGESPSPQTTLINIFFQKEVKTVERIYRQKEINSMR